MEINNQVFPVNMFDAILPAVERLPEVGWIMKDKAKVLDSKRQAIIKAIFELHDDTEEFIADVLIDWTEEEAKEAGLMF